MHISIPSDAFAASADGAGDRGYRAGMVHRDSAMRGLIVLAIVALFTGLIVVSNEADAARESAHLWDLQTMR